MAVPVVLSPIGNDAPFVDSSGNPLSGGLIYFYEAGTVTPLATYTTNIGDVQNANPVVLNANGYPASAGSVVQIWFAENYTYKAVLKTSAGVTVWTRDNIAGINDSSFQASQWVDGPLPTYVSATSFTLAGDQTANFQVGRRVKTTNTSGTVYSTISASAYTSLTTVTVINDPGGNTLDSGLSVVSYSIISSTGSALFPSGVSGTWTPADGSGAGLSFTVTDARFVKVGRLVTISAAITWPATADATAITVSGLPFPSFNGTSSLMAAGPCGTGNATVNGLLAVVNSPNSSTMRFLTAAGAGVTNATLSTIKITFTISYIANA